MNGALNLLDLILYSFLSQLEKDQWLVGGDKYKWAMQHLMGEVEGVRILLYGSVVLKLNIVYDISTS